MSTFGASGESLCMGLCEENGGGNSELIFGALVDVRDSCTEPDVWPVIVLSGQGEQVG